MIRSMTGYARAEYRGDLGAMVCELRSVNHRYLEFGFRIAEELRALEGDLRSRAQARLGRGKIDCLLVFRPPVSATDRVRVNEGLVNSLVDATHRIEGMMNNPARMTAMELLAWPGVAVEPEMDVNPLRQQALELFDAALEDLVSGRAREGERLAALIEARCRGVGGIVSTLRERRPEVLAALRDRLMTRIAEMNVQPDAERLEQEIAIVAQKSDVDEELDRLDSHCDEVAAALARKEPVGRRLDFLMQEFNREANTLASKAADIDTTQSAVELKVLVEQMREQVQNIE